MAPPIERDAADAEVLAQVVAYYNKTPQAEPEHSRTEQTLGLGGLGRAAVGVDPIENSTETYAVSESEKVVGGYVGTVAKFSPYFTAGATVVDAACTAVDYF